ncbi:MAG TPA: hypothetical protein VND80_00580 [Steroidobacteraceae bacterium]|nr:hypothetical protein [Steroidobacteraceae bacterium]
MLTDTAQPAAVRDKARANEPIGRPPGPHAIKAVACYCGGDDASDAAEALASDAALAAALAAYASLAAADALSEGAVAIAELSDDAAGASVFLPQAVNTKAAAITLRTSLVFIYRYPKLIFDV